MCPELNAETPSGTYYIDTGKYTTRKILLLPLENKLHIFAPPLNIFCVFNGAYKIFMHSPPQFHRTRS